jgi:hypothetical protein
MRTNAQVGSSGGGGDSLTVYRWVTFPSLAELQTTRKGRKTVRFGELNDRGTGGPEVRGRNRRCSAQEVKSMQLKELVVRLTKEDT